jgi:Arc/MetJ family transcription regulator
MWDKIRMVWVLIHTAMKMTMNIDESILNEVMEITGARTKTAAVEMALAEMARRRKLGKTLRALAAVPGDEMAAGYDFSAHDAREKVVYAFPHPKAGRVAEDLMD